MIAGTKNRIGDEITLKGISLKFMVELNERYSDVTFRMFVVKKAKDDTLDSSRRGRARRPPAGRGWLQCCPPFVPLHF